jgi:hypothetical protein
MKNVLSLFQLWSGIFSSARRQIDLFAKTAPVDVPTDFTIIPTKPIRLPSWIWFYRPGKTGRAFGKHHYW